MKQSVVQGTVLLPKCVCLKGTVVKSFGFGPVLPEFEFCSYHVINQLTNALFSKIKSCWPQSLHLKDGRPINYFSGYCEIR